MSTNKIINIQENFLNQARKENIPVTIHLVNGFQIKGTIRGFDQFTVVIDAMGRQQMVFKHAISTITPAKPLGNIAQFPEAKEDENLPITEKVEEE
ncbi:MAG: RNA chaperone Hfq [Selenomonadaceae bacterium]|nr:RNA chaperone Hfq [Selenomonadaceae bacterium]